jgi:hypothetical protein
MRIIQECRLWGKLKFWALENPKGYLRQFLGIPHYTFEQWQFTGNRSKRADIWGFFKEPVPLVKERPPVLLHTSRNGIEYDKVWSRPKCPPEYAHLKLDRAGIRAITPSGFAAAFFKANQ